MPIEDDDSIPYGRPSIDQDDVDHVVEVLGSDWLTTGPMVPRFEERLARTVEADRAVAVSSGTAALHAALHATAIDPGDEVIVPPMTFASTANAVLFAGGRPVFADVDPVRLLVDPDAVAEAITDATRAIIAVDYTGHPCDYDALRDLADDHDLTLIADGCHALGATYRGEPVGSIADLTAFSFHPVKQVTTGEGGAVTTDDAEAADRMEQFRNHGLTSDHREREEEGTWYYEMTELGYNYRLSDIHCALGISQLDKLERFVKRRRELAARYKAALSDLPVEPLGVDPAVEHAYHLYVVQLRPDLADRRRSLFETLRGRGIGVHVHYIPVHLHPYYRENLGTGPGDHPVVEAAYERILTLPMFPAMNDDDVDRVGEELGEAIR